MPRLPITYNEQEVIQMLNDGSNVKEIAYKKGWTNRRAYHVCDLIRKKYKARTMIELLFKLYKEKNTNG
jgi:DNA-binding NarL/FixJ family response regulator